MYSFEEHIYVNEVPRNQLVVLGADIGGTNSNFGIFTADGDTLLLSLHAKSQLVTNFTDLVSDVIAYCQQTYALRITHACFAAAGVVSADRMYCKPTNLPLALDVHDIIQRTPLECGFLVNDFAVIGYGLSRIDQKNLVQVKSGDPMAKEMRIIVGAGTGLGKSILWWNNQVNRYVPVESEGGHADFAAQSEEEFKLVRFIQNREERSCAISWEDVLSGNGIQRIYRYFRETNNTVPADTELEHNGLHPDTIFKSRTRDDHAWHTYQYYARFYARCAKNFALDALARGGVYIAGGIAAKNLELFEQDEFLQEFVNCGKLEALLKKMPIYVITDYNVSLYGAAEYLKLEGYCRV